VRDGVRYLLSFAAAFVGTLALTPVAWRLAVRFGLVDRPEEYHKTHARITPYLGGLAVMVGLVAVGTVTAGTDGQAMTILAGAVVLGAVGLRDDYRTVSPWIRIGIEAAAAVSLWFVGIRAGIFWIPALDLAVTVLWVVAVVNAFNMTDNMDGLAGGVAAAASLGIGTVTAMQGDYLVAAFAFAVAGASLGFLRYNFPPAKIFLGDAGSMLLGFLVAALTLHLDLVREHDPTRIAIIVLLVAVPLFDLSLVVIARLLGRRPLWRGGTDHASHRLRHNGYSGTRLAVVMPVTQLAASGVAVAVYAVASAAFTWWVIGIGAAIWLGMLVVLLRMPHPGTLVVTSGGETGRGEPTRATVRIRR
jgi:UDP-GlcNAc:undecaprenyl-phosphate/decaprenyl-phosphate GlcNAc-1-phosphate transferase